jgi:hypothetical protein
VTVVQRARVPGSDRLVWLVLGDDHLPVEPVRRYLAYLDDVERSPNTLRAYAHHLKLFWDYLDWAKLAWTDVGLGQLARFMAWLRRQNPDVSPFGEATNRRRESTINTILAAVNSFYEFHERLGSLRALLISSEKGLFRNCGENRPSSPTGCDVTLEAPQPVVVDDPNSPGSRKSLKSTHASPERRPRQSGSLALVDQRP